MNTINNDFINARRKEIGKRIAFERKKKGKSQAEFAEDLSKYFYGAKFSQTTISAWENSDNSIPIEKIFAMADYFGCDCGYLLCDYDERIHGVSDVCEFTGLSEKTIEFLHTLKYIGFATKADDYANIINILVENVYKRERESVHRPALCTLGLFLNVKYNNISIADIDNSGNVKAHDSNNIFSYDKISLNDRIIENALLMELSQTLVEMKEQLNRKDGK